MEQLIQALRSDLQANKDDKTRESGERFFKEDVRLYGIKSATVQKIAKEHFINIKHLPKSRIFDLCENLWQSGFMEESFVACNWSYGVRKQFEPADFLVFEKWVKNYISNWASCDTFCNHTIGEFLELYPNYINELKKWTRSENRWVRRASAVSLIVPARRGNFLPEIFDIANALLSDADDMVQKGYGWMLKVASQKHQAEVFDFVMEHKTAMPRTALRYAIEKMPVELREKAMKK